MGINREIVLTSQGYDTGRDFQFQVRYEVRISNSKVGSRYHFKI
jgi:hypothetical protein